MSFPRYPAYKDSGVAWLGEVPGDWEVWKLSHAFAQIGSGTTPKTDNREYYDGGDIPWVNTGDLNDGELNECEKRVTALATSDHSTLKTYPAGSLLIAMYGATIGKLAILNFAATVNQACCVFAGKSEIATKFMFYWFLGLRQQIISLATGGGQPNISQDILRSLRMASPPLPEQTQIAAFLDRETAKIDALVAEQRRLMALLKEKRQAVISHAVTRGLNPNAPMKPSGIDWLGEVPGHWEKLPLSRTATADRSLFIDGDWIESKDLSDDGIRYLTSGNVGDGYYKEQGQGYISEETFTALNCVEVIPGDVLISRLNLPIGRACLVPDLGGRIVTCVDNVIVRPDPDFDRRFFVYQLTSKSHFANMENLARGTTMQRISRSVLGRVRFAFPPLPEQTQIAAFLDRETAKLDTLTTEAQRAIDLLQERRTALISAAVTGQIDVRGAVVG